MVQRHCMGATGPHHAAEEPPYQAAEEPPSQVPLHQESPTWGQVTILHLSGCGSQTGGPLTGVPKSAMVLPRQNPTPGCSQPKTKPYTQVERYTWLPMEVDVDAGPPLPRPGVVRCPCVQVAPESPGCSQLEGTEGGGAALQGHRRLEAHWTCRRKPVA
ncbi:hypothetical protein NHX12_005362 [Muraenolepis orangiensis]|uniref:Uncharacterized protein n=1 Tax=Muraenolepis orangiensis TaxID=630683 RepID=A0A9Q0DR76_9TELE|nr:hypothetical protein NHX12_005362 [Muraenolepis orangiensis]